MIYLLDNNVLSELWKPKPDAAVVAWFFSSDWYLPAPVIAEIQEGAEASPGAARRLEINAKLDAIASIRLSQNACGWRLTSGEYFNRPQVRADSTSQSITVAPCAVKKAVRHEATVATRNVKDFRHARTFNPWAHKEKH